MTLWRTGRRPVRYFRTDLDFAFLAFEDEDRAIAITAGNGTHQVMPIDLTRPVSAANSTGQPLPEREGRTALAVDTLLAWTVTAR